MKSLIPAERIENRIYVLRGHRVMLDSDLAELYGVPTKRLNEQVKRNRKRFPKDFMFRLTATEARAIAFLRSQSVTSSGGAAALRSQFATLKRGQHLKYKPYAFTEHGAVMLASVLNSSVAIEASIQVVRAFVRMRTTITLKERLTKRIDSLERRAGKHDADLQTVLVILRKLITPLPTPPRRPMGFSADRKP